MVKKISHLDDNQLIEAVIDEHGLDGLLRRHLSECPACRAQKEELQAGLTRFGEISRGEIPPGYKKPAFIEKNAGGMVNAWRIHPALAFCAALTVLVLFLTPIVINRDKVFTRSVVYREMLQDEKFMAEVKNLEEDPMPGLDENISGSGSQKPNIESHKPDAKNNGGPAPTGGSQNA